MNIIKAKEAELIKNPHNVNVGKLYDTKHAQAMHITLKPGESLKKHITPIDVFFYVLEGVGIVEIGDEKQQATADTLIDSPAKIRHSWYNESDKDVRILVVKVPRPTETTRLL